MRKIVVSAVIASLVAVSTASTASGARPVDSDEGCEAQNPLQPVCEFTVTHTSSTPVTGAGGIGDWLVTVKRGRKTLEYESLPDGRPTFLEISFRIGDKVTAEALSPGSGLTAGHFDP